MNSLVIYFVGSLLRILQFMFFARAIMSWFVPVSYTHLDVYKRQSYLSAPRILQEEPQGPVRTRMAQPVEPVTEPTPAVHTPAPEPEDEPMVVVPSVSAPEVKSKPQILQPLDTGVRVICLLYTSRCV